MNDETPTPMILTCPKCGERHIDRGEFETKVHHTHACQNCGLPWRPAIVPTVGVQFLPGFKDEPMLHPLVAAVIAPPRPNATIGRGTGLPPEPMFSAEELAEIDRRKRESTRLTKEEHDARDPVLRAFANAATDPRQETDEERRKVAEATNDPRPTTVESVRTRLLFSRAVDALSAGRPGFGGLEESFSESEIHSLIRDLQVAADLSRTAAQAVAVDPCHTGGLTAQLIAKAMGRLAITDKEKLMSGEEYLDHITAARRAMAVHKPKSILQDWVQELGLRHQGILVSAVRGCDTAPKESGAKSLSRYFRSAVLNAHCGDPMMSKSFIEVPSTVSFRHAEKDFFNEWDALPLHYIMHLTHAAEIIGYANPVLPFVNTDLSGAHVAHRVAELWLAFYMRICKKMHITPETKGELDGRLNKDEAAFAADQKQ